MYPMTYRARLLAGTLCCMVLTGCDAITNQGRDSAAAPTPNVILSGRVTGLGSRPLVLQNNGANDRSFSNTGYISFGAIPRGSSYNVTIKQQPYGRTCDLSGGTGTASTDVTNIEVTCTRDSTPQFHVSGTISNLVPGATGLQLKLHTEEGDELVAIPDGQTAFAFQSPVLPTFGYAVSVATNPAAGGVAHNCAVTNGTGTIPGTGGADVTNVAVSCSFTVGGTVAFPLVFFGPAPAIASPGVGLSLSQGGPPLATVNVTGTPFQFPGRQLSTAAAFYTVAITSQPPGQTCVLRSGGGAASITLTTPGNITSIALACTGIPAPGDQLTGTYRSAAGRDVLTFFANGTFLYGAHPATGGAAASGVEQGLYGAGFNGPDSRFLAITTDTNGAGGISSSSADMGFVSLVGITRTASDITFARMYGFSPVITTQPSTYAVAASTAGQLRGAWATSDAFRVFVYDSVGGTGYHMGVNGAPNLQDVCLAVPNPAAATGSYTQDRSSACTVAGGVVDTDPTAVFGGFFGLPGAPAGGTSPAINYSVGVGSPDTLTLQPGGPPINWVRSVPN